MAKPPTSGAEQGLGPIGPQGPQGRAREAQQGIPQAEGARGEQLVPLALGSLGPAPLLVALPLQGGALGLVLPFGDRAGAQEEGLGNLKGVRQIMSDYAGRVGELVSFDGQYTAMVAVSYTHLTLPTN